MFQTNEPHGHSGSNNVSAQIPHIKDPRQSAAPLDPCTKPTNIFRGPSGFVAPYNRQQLPYKSAYQDEGSPQFGNFESMSTQPHSSRVDSTAYRRRRAEDSKAFLNRSPLEDELPDFSQLRGKKRDPPAQQELSVENLLAVTEQEEQERGTIFEAPKNSLSDSNREVILLPQHLKNFFPCLMNPSELPDFLARPGCVPSEHEPYYQNKSPELNEAMSMEEFNHHIDSMREFMVIVLRVAFNNINHHWKNDTARQLYDSFFGKSSDPNQDPRKSPDYSKRLKSYMDTYVYEHTPEQGYELTNERLIETKKSVEDEIEHNLYSALVIMFRVLKLLRMQDSIGNTPQQRYLFVAACIMAANQSEVNIRGRPLFPKSIVKALFVCHNYNEVILAEQNRNLSMGILSYEQWCHHYLPLLIQMYNGVLSTLDYQLTVLYPVDYIEQAIPVNHPWRSKVLRHCRIMTYQQDGWSEYINSALFSHPRELALLIFDRVVQSFQQDFCQYSAQAAELRSIEANLKASLELTHQQFASAQATGDEVQASLMKSQLEQMTTQFEQTSSQALEIEQMLQTEGFQTCTSTQEKRGVLEMFHQHEQDYVIQGILNVNQVLVRDLHQSLGEAQPE